MEQECSQDDGRRQNHNPFKGQEHITQEKSLGSRYLKGHYHGNTLTLATTFFYSGIKILYWAGFSKLESFIKKK